MIPYGGHLDGQDLSGCPPFGFSAKCDTIVLSVFIALLFLVLPAILALDFPMSLFCWYVALGVLFNTSLRSGDVRLLWEALKRHPRSGTIEFVIVLAVLVLLYTTLPGVAV